MGSRKALLWTTLTLTYYDNARMVTRHSSKRFVKHYSHCTCDALVSMLITNFPSPPSARYRRDERTWRRRLTDLHQNWRPLYAGMADAYLRWRYGCGVDSKPTTSQPTSLPPTADGVAEGDPPLSAASATSDSVHSPVGDTLLNTAATIHTSANDTAMGDILATDLPANNDPANNPNANSVPATSAGANPVSSNLSGTAGDGFEGSDLPSRGVDIEISVIDIYTLSTSIKVSSADEGTTASVLADRGFIGNAPFKPSVAISMKTLELYRLLRRRKPSFSIEAFVKVISDLYLVCFPFAPHHAILDAQTDPLSSQISLCIFRCL